MRRSYLLVLTSIMFLLTTSFTDARKQVSSTFKSTTVLRSSNTASNWCKKTFNPKNVFSTLTDYVVTQELGGLTPTQLHIHLEAGSIEPYIWRAYINVHLYFYGGTGYWVGTGPLKYWVPQWGYGELQFTADIAAGDVSGDTYWDLEEGDVFDNQYYLVSWGSAEHG